MVVVAAVLSTLVLSTGVGHAASNNDSATLHYGLDMSPSIYLDPLEWKASGVGERPFMDLIYDTMIHETPQGDKPGLATKWDVVDAYTLDLTLRKGVKFQDGTPFNADAVKFSWDRVIASPPGVTIKAEVKALQSVTVLDPYKVEVKLNAPLIGNWILQELRASYDGFGVVSPTAFQKMGEAAFRQHPVGAGPYAFDSFTQNQQVSLKKFKGYYDAKDWHFGNVDFMQVTAGAPTVTALASGTIDVASVGTADAESIKAIPSLAVTATTSPSGSQWLLALCTSRPPFNTLEARQALAMAIDRKDLAKTAFHDYTVPTDLPLSVDNPNYAKNLAFTQNKFNVKKAKNALRKAGVADGTPIKLLWQQTVADEGPASELIQSQLSKVGLNVSLVPSTNLPRDNYALDWNLEFQLLGPNTISAAYTPNGSVNGCGYNNPTMLQGLTGGLDATATPAATAASWRVFQQQFIDDVPAVALGTPQNVAGHSKKLQGITYVFNATTGVLLRGAHFS
jgi:ABC-type transport system substrate-binding protein